MASVETLITSMYDILPILKKTRLRRVLTIAMICVITFLMGLILCTRAGTYWIEIFDNYSGNWAIFIIGIFECISVAWFYGFEKFRADVSTMLGDRLVYHWTFNIWRILWTVVTPGLLVVNLI